MQRLGNLYENLLNIETIKEIIVKASKGKKKRKGVQLVLNNIDYYANEIVQMLKDKTYYMLPTHSKEIMEKGKKRTLTISPFYPNRILDYILVETLKPHIKKSMYYYCIGNVDGKGMMFGKKIVAKKCKKYKYYIKLDIKHFYPSTTSQALYDFIEKKIKDRDFLELCKCVVLSVNDMPIGSYYSQWFSNWFLQDLDHYIKEELKIPFYIRYVDDMLLMGNNKRQLKRAMYQIGEKIKPKGLILKRNEQVYTLEQRPIDFLGFRFTPKRVELRIRNFRHLNNKIRNVRHRKHLCITQARSFMSVIGWLKQVKCGYLYYKNHIKQLIRLGTLRNIISCYSLNAMA